MLDVADVHRLACTCSTLASVCSEDGPVWRAKVEQAFSGTPVEPELWLGPRTDRQASACADQWPSPSFRRAVPDLQGRCQPCKQL
jgi:hypothetical protein